MNILKLDGKNIRNLFVVLTAIALVSILYYFYDLKYPNHFVGDMYGIEVVSRVYILLMIILLLLIGMILIVIGRNKKNTIIAKTGIIISISFSLILLLMSINVYFSRQKDEIRKTYTNKSTDELIKIVLKEKDQYALYPIIERKDSAAVPALCELLLDENQNVNLRIISAGALGQIGGDMARNALDKAITQSKNSYLLDAIRFAKETIDRSENKVVQ